MADLFRDERSEKEKRSWSARCGHVKRKIFANEPLQGKTLIFALQVLETSKQSENDITVIISNKIRKGEKLSDYEKSAMEDAILTHSKLSGE